MIYYYYYFIFELFYWRCEYFNAISATKCFGIPKDLPRLILVNCDFLRFVPVISLRCGRYVEFFVFFIFNSLVKV